MKLSLENLASVIHSLDQSILDDNSWHYVVSQVEQAFPGMLEYLRLLEPDTNFSLYKDGEKVS